MTYAKGRIVHDADSHVMEPSDWLAPYAEGELAERLRPRATPWDPLESTCRHASLSIL